MNVMEKIIREQCKPEVTDFRIGDTVKVHNRIIEGENERIQLFSGIVIARKGTGVQETFTVRRISFGQGVEKVFPIHSPRVAKIEVERRGKVRRAKLYYLRDKIGKSAKVKELRYSR
ncbi:MAG: 50S ribosomal protein L19 [Lentisphaerae bacterium GWF2_45_14]|nr:MAG: 50S ribosomal protein L19 [Lentisphaerae bacterium GWF2_45_14]